MGSLHHPLPHRLLAGLLAVSVAALPGCGGDGPADSARRAPAAASADLILRGGKVATVDADPGTVEMLRRRVQLAAEDALRDGVTPYTVNNAYAAFGEYLKGTLTPGKLADIVVLSRDILTIPDAEIPDAEVDMTFVGGVLRDER